MDAAGTPATDIMEYQHAALSPASHGDAAKVTTESEAAAPKPANALTPPTSEEMNVDERKQEHEESDLSDLDMDEEEEDDEEIEPDHYSDGGKIPVFKPTMDQFRDFKRFIEKVNKYGMKSGIAKVIPPPEWRESLPQLDEYVKRIKIKNPITQEFNGTFGTYTQQNVEKQRSYNLPEWKALTEETQHQPPAKRGERRRNQEKVVRGGGGLRGRNSAAGTETREDSPTPKKKPGRPKRGQAKVEDAESGGEEAGPRKTRGKAASAADSPATKAGKFKPGSKARGGRQSKGGPGQAKSVTSRRLNNTAEAAEFVDEVAFKNFNYHLDGVEEYTPERCAELETHYWKSLSFNQPMYAADMPGSLFDDSVTSWNVAHLPNLLDVLGTKVPGVNTAYLYMGMWKATFAWHLEDVDLYSINYIHFGAPKQWYSISQEDARKFEAAMRQVWPVDAKSCDQFLRHKTYLISPDVLQKQYGVKVNKLVHNEGEFVITYPYGYHSGFNLGYNCAESVNFATESWLEFGRIARKCNCESDNVWVDVSEIERKLRGEPTPEYYEETDDEDDLSDGEGGNLMTPPASVKGKAARGKKRKRETKEEKPKKKKKIRIKIRAPTREPCVMCPNDNPWELLLPTDTGKKAHRCCALYTPETWIERDSNGNEKICGVASIDRARLELKCNFCRSKRGACFQCSSKKCTRAFHASCAAAAGVLVDAGMVPTFGEDGTEYFEEGYDFRCKYHRPKMDKHMTVEKIEAGSKRIFAYAKEVKINEVVQAQYLASEVFAGLVVENRPGEQSMVVDVLPEGYVAPVISTPYDLIADFVNRERVEVEWKWLCLLDPDDSQRPMPSATAQPMPKGMNKMAVSVNNRQDGVPEQGEPFNDNPEFKWHDFYNMHMPPPNFTSKVLQTPGPLKVDVNAADTLYYYLPTISTEAKCLYTDKAGGMEVAPKANFLDRVATRAVYPYIAQAQQRIAASNTAKQPIMRAVPQPPPQIQHQPGTTVNGNPARSLERPYMYKPKEPVRANNLWGVDTNALQTQRDFLADAQRRSTQQFNLPQPNPQCGDYQGSDPAMNAAPLRPFAREHYYSTATLPAAFPGEYSGFSQVAGRLSHGSRRSSIQPSAPYQPNYQSVKEQKAQLKQSGAPTVPAMGGGAMPPNPYTSTSSRPSSSAHSNHGSIVGVPLTQATTASSMSKLPETLPGYLENLQKYPYLKNSFLRRTSYVSPYAADGGFTEVYDPLTLDERKATGAHTPPTSNRDPEVYPNQPWTPPSKVWHESGNSKHQHSPPPMPTIQQHYQQPPFPNPPRQYMQPTYQTTNEFRQSFQTPAAATAPQGGSMMPSTASREGAQARLLRDQGYGVGPYAPHSYAMGSPPLAPQQHNPHAAQMGMQQRAMNSGYGQAGAAPTMYDTAKMVWNSPQAPTPSPLSDQNTPGGARGWGALPRSQHAAPMMGMAGMGGTAGVHAVGTGEMGMSREDAMGFPAMLPQMQHGSGQGQGHETYRY
ncbi:hypothetical protein LTR91_015759 [Friedmanniomyces endolithicus]|uniref:[histone H3]-trimethyl-L-lysine(9) demethylase n=1 Tax=Friedmanniomyces endolithicus TaxID=329885 RepID=A0AAN6K9B2_9PEZI|nr:hypothetical protein LTR57_014968 [Friedmanniomyces endolithicus]KAK0970904.1 hypothetical protein LTR91_015759 [Friedmanniomyces endolithicus]KAK1022811.1 hypothetical protein LTS16_025424 [Friedmanniomyces endolithicus]